jgi:phosphocarrier protein FPr
MKIALTDALHARPATLFVRLASRFASDVSIRTSACAANAKNILEVLSLGAKRGAEIDVVATGSDATAAEEALVQLVERGFDADLVPETGAAAVEGIAIGRAIVLTRLQTPEPGPTTGDGKRAPEIERARLDDALASAEADVAALVHGLPEAESELFAPEIEILRSLAPLLAAHVDAGASAEEAVRAETAAGGAATAASDLVLDAGVRLIAALSGREGEAQRVRAAMARLDGDAHDDIVLVAEDLPPSIVASLPARVVGIVASDESGSGHTSHAAILARGRDVPLAFVPPHVVASIGHGEPVVVDTTTEPARVWGAPSGSLVADARARRKARASALDDDERQSLEHLGVAVRANIGSLQERVPRAAEGIGLFRTELAFAGRSVCPSARELEIAFVVVARRAGGEPVTIRLFDAGGDKPIAWMTPPAHAPNARGMELLLMHEAVLATLLRAIAAARGVGAEVRVLLPLVRSARDVEEIRARLPPNATLAVGAMIETPDAVDGARAIAEAADFVCIGTNDLAALALGVDRAKSSTLALDARLLDLVRRVADAAHGAGRSVTVCGEIAAEQDAALALVGVGVDALSVAPSRVGRVRRRLASATREDCVAAARAILSRP